MIAVSHFIWLLASVMFVSVDKPTFALSNLPLTRFVPVTVAVTAVSVFTVTLVGSTVTPVIVAGSSAGSAAFTSNVASDFVQVTPSNV